MPRCQVPPSCAVFEQDNQKALSSKGGKGKLRVSLAHCARNSAIISAAFQAQHRTSICLLSRPVYNQALRTATGAMQRARVSMESQLLAPITEPSCKNALLQRCITSSLSLASRP